MFQQKLSEQVGNFTVDELAGAVEWIHESVADLKALFEHLPHRS